MASEELTEIVKTLTPEEQAAVQKFIEFLRIHRPPAEGSFRAAVDEFIDEHPELLRRFAQ